jgi:hypothetical protein
VKSPTLLYSLLPLISSPAPCLKIDVLFLTVLLIHVSNTTFLSFSSRFGFKIFLDSNTAHKTAEATERFKDSTKPMGQG